MGSDLPQGVPSHLKYRESWLPFDFRHDSLTERPWETLRVLTLRGTEIDFPAFKAFFGLLKRHGSLRFLKLVRLYLTFDDDFTESWEDALDVLRNTRPSNGHISICDPDGAFGGPHTWQVINHSFEHSVPGGDGAPGMRSRAEMYVMGGTDENPMKKRFQPGFIEPESATE